MMSILIFCTLLLVLSWFLVPMAWARLILAGGRKSAGLRSAFVESEHGKWHYLEGGKGPVLIAIHGFGGDADNWLRIARPLTRKFRVIAPDLPGFGRSSDNGRLSFDIDSQVQRLRTFLEALDINPVVLLGSSMGGWISAAYAARYPGDLRGLWLMAPLGVEDCIKGGFQHAIDENIQSPFEAKGLKQFRQRILIPMFGKLPWTPYPLQINYTRAAEKLSHDAANRFNEIRNESEALESIASRLTMPVLLQWGTMDRAVDVSGAAVLEKALANPTVEIQDHVGHLPMLETPAGSLELFWRFCERQRIL